MLLLLLLLIYIDGIVFVLSTGKITEKEFESLSTDGINEYMKGLRENHPRFRDRFSEQTWLKQGVSADPIMKKIRERLVMLP